MTRRVLLRLGAVTLLALVIAYVARHTYWTEVRIPLPPQGEARTNPFYPVQRFAEALGARTAWDRTFTTPPAEAVVVVSSWHWNLSARRREALEGWVESGGRLVVDALLLGEDTAFEQWSGIEREYPPPPDADAPGDERPSPCTTLSEERRAPEAGGGRYWLCDGDESWLTTRRPILWGLRGADGLQAVRVAVGHGTVTVVNATPFRYRELFNGDHGALFVAAAGLERGDEVRFLSEDDHPGLLELTWQHGASVVVLAFGAIALALWRGASRFGPIQPPPEPVRRSLAEQIRGAGRFVLQHGDGAALHAAVLRALHAAAARRIPQYARLPPDRQISALAEATGFDRTALTAAVHYDGMRSPHEIRGTLELLESARRALANDFTGRSHGRD